MYSVEQYSCAVLLQIMYHGKKIVPNILIKKFMSTVLCKENIQNSGKILKDMFSAEQRGQYKKNCIVN
jgi:hypothetical protein